MDSPTLSRNFSPPAPRSLAKAELQKSFNQNTIVLAHLINDSLPDSREKSSALTQLENALYCALAAVDRS